MKLIVLKTCCGNLFNLCVKTYHLMFGNVYLMLITTWHSLMSDLGVSSCKNRFCMAKTGFVWRCRLQFLFFQTQDVPFPMPVLVHPPKQTSYSWGPSFYPPGSVVNSGTCHFMQPNSLEFQPAQEWRTLDLMVAEWKRAMRRLHQHELEEVIRAFVDVRHLRLVMPCMVVDGLHRLTPCCFTNIFIVSALLHCIASVACFVGAR